MHELGNNERTIVTQASGIYVYDSDGNKMIDGPAGMWCVNVGYGRHEIAEAMAKQAIEMPYSSPFSMGAQPSGVLAEKLAALAPGDLNHVFFRTGGSTAVDSALRFLGFYNNFLGRPEKNRRLLAEFLDGSLRQQPAAVHQHHALGHRLQLV